MTEWLSRHLSREVVVGAEVETELPICFGSSSSSGSGTVFREAIRTALQPAWVGGARDWSAMFDFVLRGP